jgi:hypothetical protein
VALVETRRLELETVGLEEMSSLLLGLAELRQADLRGPLEPFRLLVLFQLQLLPRRLSQMRGLLFCRRLVEPSFLRMPVRLLVLSCQSDELTGMR